MDNWSRSAVSPASKCSFIDWMNPRCWEHILFWVFAIILPRLVSMPNPSFSRLRCSWSFIQWYKRIGRRVARITSTLNSFIFTSEWILIIGLRRRAKFNRRAVLVVVEVEKLALASTKPVREGVAISRMAGDLLSLTLCRPHKPSQLHGLRLAPLPDA